MEREVEVEAEEEKKLSKSLGGRIRLEMSSSMSVRLVVCGAERKARKEGVVSFGFFKEM